MTLGLWDLVYIVTGAAEALVCLALVLRTVPLLRDERRCVPAALFLFAVVSLLLSDAYWIVYTLLRPDTRMPIAAHEIAENAFFLLLAAALDAVFRENRVPAKRETLCAALFALASTALWIVWTGEWVQDIIGGAAFGYLLCLCARALKQTESLKPYEWRLLGAFGGGSLLLLGAGLLVPEPFVLPLEILSYVLMFAVLLALLGKTLCAARQGAAAKTRMALSFSLYAWSVSSMFLSEDWVYIAAWFFSFLTLPLMLDAVKKEVAG